MADNDKRGRVAIPQILREIPPKKFRELIETLLGGPLQQQTAGSRRRTIEDPTEEQRRTLSDGGIMLPDQRCEKLLFETDWLPADRVSEFARSIAQVAYLGAMSDSRFQRNDGTEESCADAWEELLRSAPGDPVEPWSERSETSHETLIGSICQGIVERVEREAEDAAQCPKCGEPYDPDAGGGNWIACPDCGAPVRPAAIVCPHCGGPSN